MNCLYDLSDWQYYAAFDTAINLVNDPFEIEVYTSYELDKSKGEEFRILLSSPSFTTHVSPASRPPQAPAVIVTMHVPEVTVEDVFLQGVSPRASSISTKASHPADAHKLHKDIQNAITASQSESFSPIQDSHPRLIDKSSTFNEEYPNSEEVDSTLTVTAVQTYVSRIRYNFTSFPCSGFYDWRVVVVDNTGATKTISAVFPVVQDATGAASDVHSGKKISRLIITPREGEETTRDWDKSLIKSTERSSEPNRPFLPLMMRIAQGRAIVHRSGAMVDKWHCLMVDLENINITERGTIKKLGTFRDIENKLPSLKEWGVNMLYLFGAIERDNGWGEREGDSAPQPNQSNRNLPEKNAPLRGTTFRDSFFAQQRSEGFEYSSEFDADSDTHGHYVSMDKSYLGGGPSGYSTPGAHSDIFLQNAQHPMEDPTLPAGDRSHAMRPDANPYAVTDRTAPCRMLGGWAELRSLATRATNLDIRLFVQLDAFISSSRAHRKYKHLAAQTLDTSGQIVKHCGTDIHENQWEDTVLLNYRKVETWNLLVSEAKQLVSSLKLGGLYLPDAQSYPFILKHDETELLRQDPDGENHYTPREVLEGEVIISNSEWGYWSTQAAKTYANPLLVKLMRELWAMDPSITVVGECHWGRMGALGRSGIIPHTVALATGTASTTDRLMDKIGAVFPANQPHSISPIHLLKAILAGEAHGMIPPQIAPQYRNLYAEKGCPNPLTELFLDPGGAMPKGLQQIQLRSLTSPRMPYPALVFGRAAWTAVDLLHTLPGVAITFGDERIGKSYRVDVAGTYRPNLAYLEGEKKKMERRIQMAKHQQKLQERAHSFGGWNRLANRPLFGADALGFLYNQNQNNFLPNILRGEVLSLPVSGQSAQSGLMPETETDAREGEVPGKGIRSSFSEQTVDTQIVHNVAEGSTQRKAEESGESRSTRSSPLTNAKDGSQQLEQHQAPPPYHPSEHTGMWYEGHLGAGGVVPAPLPPPEAVDYTPSKRMLRSGFSHLNLQDTAAIVTQLATRTAPPDEHRPSDSLAVETPPMSDYDQSLTTATGFASPMNLRLGRVQSVSKGLSVASSPSLQNLLRQEQIYSFSPPLQKETIPEPPPFPSTPHYRNGAQAATSLRAPKAIANVVNAQSVASEPTLRPLEGAAHSSSLSINDGEDEEIDIHEAFSSLFSTHNPIIQRGISDSHNEKSIVLPSVSTRPLANSDLSRVQSWQVVEGLRGTGLGGPGTGPNLTMLEMLEARNRAEIGPEFGFDLAYMEKHFRHREACRRRFPVLRKGNLTVLTARHRFGEHGNVLAFGRYIPGTVAVVACNFNNHISTVAVDTSPLASYFGATSTFDASASVNQLMTASLLYGTNLRKWLGEQEEAKSDQDTSAGLSMTGLSSSTSVSEVPQQMHSGQITSDSDTKTPGVDGLPHEQDASALATTKFHVSEPLLTDLPNLPSLNLRGGVWEARDIMQSSGDWDMSEVQQSDRLTFSESDGPLIAILAADEAAYAPMMISLQPYKSFCCVFSPAAGAQVPHVKSPLLSPSHLVSKPDSARVRMDRDVDTDPAAMQWLFASSILRLQSMLRLKEVGLNSAIITRSDIEVAGGYESFLAKRKGQVGSVSETWISPGDMLKDEEVQAAARHNLVYSLLRNIVKRSYRNYRSIQKSLRRMTPEAGKAAMDKLARNTAEMLEAALRVLVTHFQMYVHHEGNTPQAGQSDELVTQPTGNSSQSDSPKWDEGTFETGRLRVEPLPPLHGAMHRPDDGRNDSTWYCVDADVATVVLRAALFLAVKDTVSQAQHEDERAEQAQGAPKKVESTSDPTSSDVSEQDAVMSALLLRSLLHLSQGNFTGKHLSSPKLQQLSPSIKRVEEAVVTLSRQLLLSNQLGKIVFVTPELGKWSTVGGLGVMVDELSVGLAEIGADVLCISPYYHVNRKGISDYLAGDGIVYKGMNVGVNVAGEHLVFGLHEGSIKGVDLIFLHNSLVFPRPYPPHDAYSQTRVMVAFAKATLETLCQLRIAPSLVITNDWFTGLVPAYARNPRFFGTAFSRTDFMHIAHNLDPDYEGRLWPNPSQGNLGHVHELDSHLLIDPYWEKIVINPTRAAILCSDTWATVSRSYRADLLASSPLKSLLRLAPHPFAHPNGIPVEARKKRLAGLRQTNHLEAKAELQRKYFGMERPNPEIPLFAFVGRITLQKGVHLILQATEQLLRECDYKIQILVGGMASEADAYGKHCAGVMMDLRHRYSKNFWADPTFFFTDGDLVNLGADFCLMPSAFEPGGIVQQEFFVAGTPVISFRTGGLKDTVHEWDPEKETGTGFCFESYNVHDFHYAIRRALKVFSDEDMYQKLRISARGSVMDLSVVSRAWWHEFNRIRRCLPPAPAPRVKEIEVKFSVHVRDLPGCTSRSKVQLAGNFTNWVPSITLNFIPETQCFEVTTVLKAGSYTYKYVVDGTSWQVNPKAPIAEDSSKNSEYTLWSRIFPSFHISIIDFLLQPIPIFFRK